MSEIKEACEQVTRKRLIDWKKWPGGWRFLALMYCGAASALCYMPVTMLKVESCIRAGSCSDGFQISNSLLEIYHLFLGLWPSGELGRMTQRHPGVTAHTNVTANATLQLSVEIRHISEVPMNMQDNTNMMNKTVSKIKSLLITVLCISCLSSAPTTRGQE